MKIFVICSVRDADDAYRKKLEMYTDELEANGHTVHLPHRDTNQKATGIEICTQNMNAIKAADEVHIFYNPASQGTHFDMGITFALNKKIKIVESAPYVKGKSYAKFLEEYKEFIDGH